jgi:hypothetical protein
VEREWRCNSGLLQGSCPCTKPVSFTGPQEVTFTTYVRRVKVALRQEHLRPWHEMEQDFSECEYRGVRDRQMKELEDEDDLPSKIPVRNLRVKLYKESKEFVRQQRIHCLLQGSWFLNAVPVSAPVPRRPARQWRFLRLVRCSLLFSPSPLLPTIRVPES